MFAQKFVLTKKGLEQRRRCFQHIKQKRFLHQNNKRKHEPRLYPPSSTPPHEDGKKKEARE
jgi:hypothetical protein